MVVKRVGKGCQNSLELESKIDLEQVLQVSMCVDSRRIIGSYRIVCLTVIVSSHDMVVFKPQIPNYQQQQLPHTVNIYFFGNIYFHRIESNTLAYCYLYDYIIQISLRTHSHIRTTRK